MTLEFPPRLRPRTRPDPRSEPSRSTSTPSAAGTAGAMRETTAQTAAPFGGVRIGGTQSVAKVTMPQLGESVAEGTIGKWLKKPGDHVAKYEPLLEVITDKVNAEVPSPFEGVLKEILVEEGATVPNNAEIAVIDEAGAAAGAPRVPPRQAPQAPSAAAASLRTRHGSSASAEAPPRRRGDRDAAAGAAASAQRGRSAPMAVRRAPRRERTCRLRRASAPRDAGQRRRAHDPGGPTPPARARPDAPR